MSSSEKWENKFELWDNHECNLFWIHRPKYWKFYKILFWSIQGGGGTRKNWNCLFESAKFYQIPSTIEKKSGRPIDREKYGENHASKVDSYPRCAIIDKN